MVSNSAAIDITTSPNTTLKWWVGRPGYQPTDLQVVSILSDEMIKSHPRKEMRLNYNITI